jgi:hypothetical protein
MSGSTVSVIRDVRIRKADAKKQIAYGEVYAPNEVDSHGEMMFAEDIEKMAHRFLKLDLAKAIDMNHDNEPAAAYPVESYVMDIDNHPDYSKGAWVMGVKVEDPTVWKKIEDGEINGFSLQALVMKSKVQVEVEVLGEDYGYTEKADNHDHLFRVELDELGNVVGGHTSVDDGHSHKITKSSATEDSRDGHSHRFFLA